MSKLTYEDKLNLYNDKKNGLSIGSLSKKYDVRKNVINYLTALIDKHGIEIIRTNKNKYHSASEKQEAIDRVLKTEMFYDQEDKYKNIDELILAIDDYIKYYNYDRIKVKLKGLSPVNYRLKSFA